MEHIAIENLRMAVTRTFAALDTEVESTRKALAELSTAESKKTFTAEHRAQKEATIRAKAKEIGALQRAEAMNLASRLTVTKKAWDTETLMKRARLVPPSDRIESDLLEEMRRLRISADLRDATAAELAAMSGEAKDEKNLALLTMLKKEADRRMYESDADRALVKVALSKAIAEVEPEGQQQAHALIRDVELTLEHVEDAITELLSGKEPKRAEMRRVIAGQSARKDDDHGQT